MSNTRRAGNQPYRSGFCITDHHDKCSGGPFGAKTTNPVNCNCDCHKEKK